MARNSDNGLTVLVVEDEALISEMIADALEEHGFSTRCAADGRSALACLAEGGRIDALFTDINLPGDLDGATVAQQARQLRPGLPVVYASGRAGSLDSSRRVPGSAFIPKPYTPTAVCSLIDQLVGIRDLVTA